MSESSSQPSVLTVLWNCLIIILSFFEVQEPEPERVFSLCSPSSFPPQVLDLSNSTEPVGFEQTACEQLPFNIFFLVYAGRGKVMEHLLLGGEDRENRCCQHSILTSLTFAGFASMHSTLPLQYGPRLLAAAIIKSLIRELDTKFSKVISGFFFTSAQSI